MRKMLPLAIVLLLLGAVGAGYALHKWNAQAKDVSFEITTINGDRSLLDGLQVEMYDAVESKFLWHSTLEITSDQIVSLTTTKGTDDTEVSTLLTQNEKRVVNAAYNMDALYSGHEPLNVYIDRAGFSELQDQLLDPENETDYRKINLSEYLTYMPIRLTFHTYYTSKGWIEDGEADYYQYYYPAKAVSDAIQLPVPKDFMVGLRHNEVEYDYRTDVYVESICTEKEVYFAVGYRHDVAWMDLDTSNMPNGYGVYRISYSLKANDQRPDRDIITFNADQLELFFPIDEDAYVEDIFLSEDRQTMFILTQKKTGEFAVSIVSMQNRELISHIVLGSKPERPDFRFEVNPANGEECYIIYLCPALYSSESEKNVFVIAKNDEGNWDKVITISGDDFGENSPWSIDALKYGKFAYDGERLAWVYTGGTFISYKTYIFSIYNAWAGEPRMDYTNDRLMCLFVRTRKGEMFFGAMNGSLQKSYLPKDASVYNYSLTVQWK